MVSATVACLPAAVSLLSLAALFMPVSGMSLALTWPLRLCLLRVLLCPSRCYKLSPFQAHWERWHCTCVLRPVFLFTVHVGGGSSPLSCGGFLSLPLLQAFLLLITGWCCCSCQPLCLFTVHVESGSSLLSCGVFLPTTPPQAFPLLVAGCMPLLPPEPLQPSQLFYLQSWEGFPSLNLWCSVCPTLFPACLYCSYCLLLIFSFFSPGGGQSVQGGMLLWPILVCGSTAVPRSSPGLCLPKLSRRGWLVARGPSWFLHLTWSGDDLRWLEVWRGQSYAS
jgi:hypothetical protein